jgi:UDP-glucose 4-epimerase
MYCSAYAELYGLDVTILRFGIPYGPRARPSAVIPIFVRNALAGEPLTIAGDGRQSRRFVYVEDLADGVVRALAPVAANRVYNLVGAEEVTIAEIAETVRRLVGDVEIRHVPGRAADFAGATISGERAEAELGWRPTTPFREGVRRYVEWHRDGAQAPAAQRAPARARAAGALLRRGLVALVSAALAAVMIIGLASLMPVDGDMDVYDTFASTLVLLLPLVLAAGFEWREAHRRWFRAALWAVVGACVLALALPWPPVLDHLGHAHPVVLSLGALSAALAARLCGARARLGSWLAATDS